MEQTPPAATTTTETKQTEQPELKAPDVSLLKSAEEGAGKKEEPKPEEKKEEQKPAVDISTLKIPEGFSFDGEAGNSVKQIFSELGVDQAGAQKLVDLHAKMAGDISKNIQAANVENWNKINREWVEASKNAPDFGGPNFEKSLGEIAKLIDASPEPAKLREALTITGAGNNPHILRAMVSWAKAHNEPSVVKGGPAQSAGKSAAEVIYPNLKGNE